MDNVKNSIKKGIFFKKKKKTLTIFFNNESCCYFASVTSCIMKIAHCTPNR